MADLNKIETLRPFRRFCMTIGALPTTYLQSLSYLEMLTWFCEYLEKTVIPTINNNAESVMELQDLFIKLRGFVENYFANLDVQEEINNKLDEMSQDGTLENILLNFTSITKIYKTHDDIFNNKNQLQPNMKIKTLGYHAENDGGSAYYIVKNYKTDEFQEELEDNLYLTMILDSEPNSCQFGCVSGYDITSNLQNFFDQAFKNLNKSFKFMGGDFIISDTININPKILIKLIGQIKITDNNLKNISFNIISSENENSLENSIYSLFDNSNGCLWLLNNKRDLTKTAIKISSVENARINCNFKGIKAQYYNIGCSIDAFNTFLIKFKDCFFSFNNIGIYYGENDIKKNTGENICFENCTFTRNNLAFRTDFSTKLNFIECSFDFNGLCFYTNTSNSYIECDKCWIEGCGDDYNYDNIQGLIWTTTSTLWYNENVINIHHSSLMILKTSSLPINLFKNSSCVVILEDNEIWLSEQVSNILTIGDNAFNQLFLADDTVRRIKFNNNHFKLTSVLYPQSIKSITDRYFTSFNNFNDYINLSDLSTVDLGKYIVDSFNSPSSTFRTQIIDNKKCIEITPSNNGVQTQIVLTTKDYNKIQGNKFTFVCFIKGYKSINDTLALCKIKFYDKDLNEVGNFNNATIASTYRNDVTGLSPNQWFAPSTNNLGLSKDLHLSIPSNAIYFKPFITLRALNGSYQEQTIDYVTMSFDKPTYFTGIHVFNNN